MIDFNLMQIWIGPRPAPVAWMQTWRDMNPDIPYTLYDNDALNGKQWRNQPLITEYFRREEYAGVADLMRYEILYETGGFIPDADSVCLRPVFELFANTKPFTCYEIDPLLCDPLGMPRKKGLLCPILGSPRGHVVLDRLIAEIGQTSPDALEKPWKGSGNHRLRRFFRQHKDLAQQLVIYPAHMFVPEHFRGWKYEGDDKPFCRQFWGTTLGSYPGS